MSLIGKICRLRNFNCYTNVYIYLSDLEKDGNNGPYTLRPNLNLYAQGMFRTLGNAISTILSQEGPPVQIFFETVVRRILDISPEKLSPAIWEVTDGHVRKSLEQVDKN